MQKLVEAMIFEMTVAGDREQEIKQAAHDKYPHETWIFIDGAQWADSHPSEATIRRIIELYKRWYSQQLDGSATDYVLQNMEQ